MVEPGQAIELFFAIRAILFFTARFEGVVRWELKLEHQFWCIALGYNASLVKHIQYMSYLRDYIYKSIVAYLFARAIVRAVMLGLALLR